MLLLYRTRFCIHDRHDQSANRFRNNKTKCNSLMGRLTYVTFTWQCWADSGLDFTGEPGEAVQGRRTGGAARPHSTGKMT